MTYLLVLLFILAGSLWLELVLRTRVLRRWRRLLVTLALAATPFVAWDLYAIATEQWWFDAGQLVGITLPAGLPMEELLFFVVVGLAAILTLEAVRAVLDSGQPPEGPGPKSQPDPAGTSAADPSASRSAPGPLDGQTGGGRRGSA